MANHPRERFPSKINGSRPTGFIASAGHRSPAITSDNEKPDFSHSDFMNKMSHDFYTPLNIIIGFAELMLEEIPGEINEQQRSGLTDILNSSNRLLTLVDELMAKYKSESGKMA